MFYLKWALYCLETICRGGATLIFAIIVMFSILGLTYWVIRFSMDAIKLGKYKPKSWDQFMLLIAGVFVLLLVVADGYQKATKDMNTQDSSKPALVTISNPPPSASVPAAAPPVEKIKPQEIKYRTPEERSELLRTVESQRDFYYNLLVLFALIVSGFIGNYFFPRGKRAEPS